MAGVRFVGFYDSRPDRAAEVARELGVPAFESYDALVLAADALTVVVPTPAHYEVAKVALARGRHLLIEKPLATSVEEADELVRLANDAGVLVQTGHVERFNRAVRAALPFVDQPKFIESDRLAPFNPRGSEVAVVLDLMIHDIDLIATLVGSHVVDVQAVGVPLLTPSVDIANARLTFETGAVANITASRVSRERLRKIRIFQPTGYLSLDLAAGTGEFYRLRRGVDLAALAIQHFDTADAAMARSSRRAMRPAAVMGAFYRAMLDALIEAGWRDPGDRVSLSKGRKLWLVLRHGLI